MPPRVYIYKELYPKEELPFRFKFSLLIKLHRTTGQSVLPNLICWVPKGLRQICLLFMDENFTVLEGNIHIQWRMYSR